MSDNSKIETTLWKTANKLLNNIDSSEYKHVVLGLIFLIMA
jgi:type I restriction enzyme M protein